MFAKVAQHAVRNIALRTFQHLHALSLRFHLERQTGGLSRVIERGTKGIDFVLRFMVFNILPTLLEIGLVAGILMWNFGAAFGLLQTTHGSLPPFTSALLRLTSAYFRLPPLQQALTSVVSGSKSS